MHEGEVDVIIRVSISLDEARTRLAARDITIRRELKLIRGFAVTAPAPVLRNLEKEPWVTSVEPDREVHVMRDT